MDDEEKKVASGMKPDADSPQAAEPGKEVKAAPKSAVQKETKPPTKFQSFTRKLVRGLVFAVVLFGAGMLTAFFMFQKPKVSDLDSQIEALQAERSDLETQVASLEVRVEGLIPFEAENKVLTASLEDQELHVQLLSALNDVQAARLELALENPAGAKLELSRTADTLETLRGFLPADTQSEVGDMLQRLSLGLDGIDSDAFAASSDLEVLANSLIQLENTLFVMP